MWCRKTRELLGHSGAAYDLIEVDLLDAGEREEAMAEVKQWNPECTFPTLVIDGKSSIAGYQQDKIKEALGEWPEKPWMIPATTAWKNISPGCAKTPRGAATTFSPIPTCWIAW